MTAPDRHLDTDDRVSLLYLLTSALRDEAAMPETDACRIAECIVTGLAKRRGGEFIYCPSTARRTARDAQVRNAEIRARMSSPGEDADSVAKAFGMSRRRVYQICAE